MDQERMNDLIRLGEEIKKREDKMHDTRPREWMNLESKVSHALKLLIEVEDILMELDDYQMGNGQYYTDFEEMYNQIADTREHFANYVDSHKELLTMDDKIDAYFESQKNINK